jgi:hypothetical protein
MVLTDTAIKALRPRQARYLVTMRRVTDLDRSWYNTSRDEPESKSAIY